MLRPSFLLPAPVQKGARYLSGKFYETHPPSRLPWGNL